MSCPDCGSAPVNHFVEKTNAAIEEFLAMLPVSVSIPNFSAASAALAGKVSLRFSVPFFKFLSAVRLGVIVDEPDSATGVRARCIWLEAGRRGIVMREFRPFGVSREIFVAEIPIHRQVNGQILPTKKVIVFNGLPRPDRTLSGKPGPPASLAWVDNKSVLKKNLSDIGIPAPRGKAVFTWKRTLETFGQLKIENPEGTVIVKPSTGSRSRHTTIGIGDEAALREAFIKAKRLSPLVIIEEELAGQVYRGTVVGGKVAGIRRRDPPQVMGDGKHSVRELIEMENRRPERQGPVYWKIKIDEYIEKNIDLDAVPALGETVSLSKKTSVFPGIGSTDVTAIAHPDVVSLLEKVAAVLDDQLVGVDFIVGDVSRPLSGQSRFGIIECNGLPFINLHHFPLTGTPRNVAGMLWDVVIRNRQPV